MNRDIPVDFLKSLNPKALPAAPGHNWEDPAFRKAHHKTQTLEREFTGKSYPVLVPGKSPRKSDSCSGGSSASSDAATITAPSAFQLMRSLQAAEEGRSDELSRKSYVSLEDKVLGFSAYFTEQVRESALETVRHRLVSIIFFPHDDTFLIQEPHLPNSGLQGGVILKRQRVPANPRQREQFPDLENVCINHIQVGAEIVIFGTAYYIYACDTASREFMESLGIQVGANQLPPTDNYARSLRAAEAFSTSSNFGVRSQDRTLDDVIRTQRYIQDSGKVLKFNAIYDDREDGGRVRHLDLLMYIEDDTVSVVERQATGEAVPSGFLSRRRLPKDGKMDKTVELTFANRVNGMRETNLGSPEAYYSPCDLRVGSVVNVFGRSVFLYDCDLFTREYFANNFGMQQPEAIDVSGIKTAPRHTPGRQGSNRPTLPTPPYTGFGSHEDSLSSCKSLALKPPRGALLDPHSRLDVLRFQMRLHNPERLEDKGRLFTLNYYVEDGEMMLQETALRNSGFTGGKFNRKQKLIKHFDGVTPTYYTLNDLTIGAVLDIAKFSFEIVACDLHTENFLAHPATKGVPPAVAANVSKERVMELQTSLKGFLTVRYVTQTEAFRAFDRDKDGNVTLAELFAGLRANLITNREEDAVALLQQISSDGLIITHGDFFKWFSAPLSYKSQHDVVDTTQVAASLREVSLTGEQRTLRNKVLRALKERLEARCLNEFEMFRIASTMPRAFKGRRADLAALTNIDKDAYITPVQLQRCVEEVLGLGFTEAELQSLLTFFFSSSDRVELKSFQDSFVIMTRVGQL